MPKVSVYLSQELYDRAKEKELPISALAQEAIEAALRRAANAEWFDRIRARPRLPKGDLGTRAVMDAVKDEWGA